MQAPLMVNGSYKIELAKAKCKYLDHQAVPKFEPTDIVPLVNMIFPKSFGRQQNKVKAITSQKWNPFNYNVTRLTWHQKQKFKTIKSQQQTKQQKIEHLKSHTKVSSAALTANNHYTLDENILQIILDKNAADEAAKAATQARKDPPPAITHRHEQNWLQGNNSFYYSSA